MSTEYCNIIGKKLKRLHWRQGGRESDFDRMQRVEENTQYLNWGDANAHTFSEESAFAFSLFAQKKP